MRAVLFLITASVFGQGVVMRTADVHFAVLNPEPVGTLMEQAARVRKKVKGHVQRYRIFVPLEAEVSLLDTVLHAPALSVVRVASLPRPGQKLSVEAVTDRGKNPNGLVFISGQGVNKNENVPKVKPMAQTAFDNIDKALKAVQLAPADVLTVTCYLSSLADSDEVWALGTSRFPMAAYNHVQTPMPYGRALVECEAVARAKGPVGFVFPEGLTKSPNFTQVAGVSAKHILWSGLHVSIGCTEGGVRFMFEVLNATVKKKGGSLHDTVFSYVYPNTIDGTDIVRKVRLDFYNKEQMPASTLIPFSGFGEKNACVGVEAALPIK